jgi:Family of unknown function (DUF6281)
MIDVDPEIARGLDEMVPGYEDAVPDWEDVLLRGPSGFRRRQARIRRLLVPALGLAVGIAIATAILTRGGPTSGVSGSGSCAFIAHYRGATYNGVSVQVAPELGRRLGTASLPSCEGGGSQTLAVAAMKGVSPAVALVWVGTNDTLLVRKGVRHLPSAVTRLLHTPACRPADAPIRLQGPWGGILGADGKTELDMRPPYDLELFTARGTPARYRRAFLTVRVPASLGRPLTEHDIHASLDKGGSITITATCAGGRYVAQRVRAHPPA